MKPYPRKFDSYEDAKAFLEKRGKLHYFGTDAENHFYNFHASDGRKFHMFLYLDGRVTYKEMTPIVYNHWRNEGW